MKFIYKDKDGLRFIHNLRTTTEHALAVEEMMMASDRPSIQFLSIKDKGTVMIGRQLKAENKVDVEKIKADGVTLRRQNTWGKVVLLSNNNELVISIAVPKSEYVGKAKELLAYFNKLVVLGNYILGIRSEETRKSANCETSKFNCFASISPGDIVASDTKIAAATFGLTHKTYVENIVIDLNGKSDVRPYLLMEETALPPTNLSMAAGTNVTLDDAVDAYFEAFNDVIGLHTEPMTVNESNIVSELIASKYTSDDWNLKQWRV